MTDASKYLGVKVTEDLTWSRHILEVAWKANRTLGFLRRKFRQCTKEVKAATYSTMVRPVLDYASTVWDPHQQGDIKILEQVQRRAARYVYNDYTTRTPGCVTAMVRDIGWESLQDRRSIARLSLIYKMHHGLVDVDTSSYLPQGDRRTRGSRGFFQDRINSEVYYNSFFPRTIQEWNNLPGDVTAGASLEEFRASLTARLP